MFITIDGPVASGKSTIARLLAKQLGFFYLNTGSIYRALAYAVLQQQKKIEKLNEAHIEIIIGKINYIFEHGKEKVFYQDEEITEKLDTPEIAEVASKVSTLPFVRTYADQLQRTIAKDKDCVIDGRDSGSVVFTDADYKFFITASDDVRAIRWQQKQASKGVNLSILQSNNQIHLRDQRDSCRPISPLKVPKGAVQLINDSDEPHLMIDQILHHLQETFEQPPHPFLK